VAVHSPAPDALAASDAPDATGTPDQTGTGLPAPSSGAASVFAPDFARALELFRLFRVEQTDPQRFYTFAAEDAVAHVDSYERVGGKLVVDVGGGPGYFADAFRAAGARYLGLDADAGEMALHGRRPEPGITVQGSGLELPFRTGSLDICFSSNVAEHVPDPKRLGDEMVRVTRPGGLIFLSYNNWLAPNGGHETAPWHYLGGDRARARFEARNGRPPKNYYGRTLFPVSVSTMLRWARHQPGAALVEAVPRYHPRWARGIVRVPGAREVLTWNLLLVLRRR
jgi:SAM-dependent methyltransferase